MEIEQSLMEIARELEELVDGDSMQGTFFLAKTFLHADTADLAAGARIGWIEYDNGYVLDVVLRQVPSLGEQDDKASGQ
ncbi:MAG TPA: hypothetical protein VGB92_26015 [Longimicrobium sp.]|jgi:hypothetical protein